jgi:hypothetical protein
MQSFSPAIFGYLLGRTPSISLPIPEEIPGLTRKISEKRHDKVSFSCIEGEPSKITVKGEISIWWDFILEEGALIANPRINRDECNGNPADRTEQLMLDFLRDTAKIEAIRFQFPEEVVKLQMPFFKAGVRNTSSFCLLSEAKEIIEEFEKENAHIIKK